MGRRLIQSKWARQMQDAGGAIETRSSSVVIKTLSFIFVKRLSNFLKELLTVVFQLT